MSRVLDICYLSESEVIRDLSPSSEIASELLQNPDTTWLNADRRLYLYRACSRRGTSTCAEVTSKNDQSFNVDSVAGSPSALARDK